MMVPTNHIAIPLNEDKDGTGQIAQFIKEFNGEGVQHIAMETSNIYTTIRKLRDNGVEFLEVPDSYYSMVSNRIDEHRENINDLQELGILIDGSKEDCILLQLFTKPIQDRPTLFFEIICRRGSQSFGKGNFKALFESIEEEQRRRGTL